MSSGGPLRANQPDWRERAERAESREQSALVELERIARRLVEVEQLASLGSRVPGIAHEINTPLGSAMAVAGAVTDKTRSLAKQLASGQLRRSELERYLHETLEGARLTQRNLEMAAELVGNLKRVAADQVSGQRRQFDLARLADDVLATLRPLTRHTEYSIRQSVPEGIIMDSCPGPLGQIITNCFNNALVHGFAGRQRGEFSLGARMVGSDRVEIVLADDGNGMSEEQRQRAFERFYTTRGANESTGLGLAIVHLIATDVLKGRVWIESRPGGGTAVHLELPCRLDMATVTGEVHK